MGNSLSTESRIHKEIGNIIARETGLDYSPELDLSSSAVRMPQIYGKPIFNVIVQKTNTVSHLPIANLRITLNFSTEVTQGEKGDDITQILMDKVSSVDKVLLSPRTAKRLQTKEFISEGFVNRVRGSNLEIIANYRTTAFKINKEY